MATATAPRHHMYLSVLAGRAITALADLAGDPLVWNERVEGGLNDGIVYCQTIRTRGTSVIRSIPSDGFNPLKRAVGSTTSEESPSVFAYAEAEKVEFFLAQLAKRERKAEIAELISAIKFLRRTATNR